MKDGYKRRRKVERPLIRTLPDVDTSDVFTPVHQESLDMDCGCGFFISTQGQEFVATCSDEWWLEVYGLGGRDKTAPFDPDSVSEISDDAVVPSRMRTALWRASPRDPERNEVGNLIFLAPDVLGFVLPESRPAAVSTWNVRTGQCLERIVLRAEYFYQIMCKISNTEFVVGSVEGHLFFFQHEGGRNLRLTRRIWKAHTAYINTISFHSDTVFTTSGDWSARLWDADTKERIAVLHHDSKVFSGTISGQYIVTCSRYGQSYWEESELRIYRNSEGYPLAKILRIHDGLFSPTLLDGGHVLCILTGHKDDDGQPLVRDTLALIDVENERLAARLKVACRGIVRHKVLSDGRLVVIGHGGCRGVIATLPRALRTLICPNTTEDQSKIRRRTMCTLM